MLSKYVMPGDKIELQAVNKVNKSEEQKNITKKVYQSRIYDVTSDDRIEIMMPMERTKLILLPVDEEFDLCFYTKNGLYQCYVRIIDRYKSDNLYLLACELTSNLRKFQRRDYYRYSCILDMDARQLEEEEITAVENRLNFLVPGLPLKRSIIVDISGGGIRFIASQPYENGSLVYCKYVLQVNGGSKEYNVIAKVLSCTELEKRNGEFEHRAEYVNMDLTTREEIIRYIFEEERKHRKMKRDE